MTRLVVLISGRGSNFKAMVQATQQQRLDAQVVAVISNRPKAAGLQFAREQGIDATVLDHTSFTDRAVFDQALAKLLADIDADWVVMAGFMRILGPELIERWSGRMINIHPSLLPLYPGLDTHTKAIRAGESWHGASVHFVTAELDAGPVIAQARVPVLPGDTAATLAERVLAQEHELYVHALQLCVSGRASYVNGQCYLDGQPRSEPVPATAT